MKILIAEDDLMQRRLLIALLQKWGHDVIVTTNGTEAWSVLSSDDPPLLAVLDWMMPGRDGLSICRELRELKDHPYTYVVLLTGKRERHDLIHAFEAGADDFLSKPFDAQELRVRLQTGTRILKLQEQLVIASTRDSLTGVLNRSAILTALDRELARAGRNGLPLGIMIADLDHFKRVNDELGHLAGDAVLRDTALLMQTGMRPYDLIGRYGGEEFLIILPGLNAADVRDRAEQIRIQASRTMHLPNGDAKIRLSIGVAATYNTVVRGDLIQSADEALYRAKDNGRNCVMVSPDSSGLRSITIDQGAVIEYR